ncbi:putative ANKRD40 C-terminal-like protein [Vipera latastei]
MSSYLEERLREAAALGNLEEVRILVRNGVAVNAQNEVNGWTSLHWACKRNQTHIVKYLLDHGANKGIFTKNRDLAAHLTSKKEIRKLLEELVLKVRVQNPKEYDFIEVELDRKQLNYQDLLKVCCCELGINSEQVEKIRKLPNTLLRKDEDVARLQNFQELELVLARSITSSQRNAAVTTLVEKTSYNIKAANLIY